MTKFTLHFNSERNPLHTSEIDQAASALKGGATKIEEAVIPAEADIVSVLATDEIISDLARAVANQVYAQLEKKGYEYSPGLILNHANMLVNRLIENALEGSIQGQCSGNLDDLWQAVDILSKDIGYNLHATGTYEDADGIKPLIYTPIIQ